MPEQKPLSCVQPVKGPIAESPQTPAQAGTKEVFMTARVGKEAPDFEAKAFADGGFKTIKLSDFRGKWLVLCFYPGDFTFV
jgi:peroxiredoxin (alkyl hydroperoxide reductase subunit C)